MNRKKSLPVSLVIPVALCLFLLSGCYINFSAYGGYRGSLEAGRMFEHPDLQAGYTYYYAHTHSNPQALLGISPGYTLNNDLWTRVDPAELGRLLDNMTIHANYQRPIYGSYVLDPHGKVIGIYYSRWRGGPVVMEPGNKVVVYLPDVREGREGDSARSTLYPRGD